MSLKLSKAGYELLIAEDIRGLQSVYRAAGTLSSLGVKHIITVLLHSVEMHYPEGPQDPPCSCALQAEESHVETDED